jgi:DNA end-binding protein Ku
LGWGRVTIPVKLFTASVEAEGRYKSLHRACGTPTTRVQWCDHCQVEITSWADTARGVEVDQAGTPIKGTRLYAIVENADLAELEGVDHVRLQHTVWHGDVDTTRLHRHYWVDASMDTYGMRAYVALVQALEINEACAIASIAMGSKELVGCFRPHDGLLVMSTVFRDDEMRSPPRNLQRMAGAVDVEPGELKAASELIEARTRTRLRTNFRQRLDEVLARKAAEGKLVGLGTPIKATRNLERALKASVPSKT